MNKTKGMKDTGFGVSIDVIKLNTTTMRIRNDWNEREMSL